ncbi:MAG: hypothetical protein GY756_19560 [bacterium]|nr:hypothetical protein [bacterium]
MRKSREINTGAVYHIVARANRGEFILHSPGSKEMFLDVLKRAKEKYPFQLKHFCIMSNHIHLLIKPARNIKLSKLMQWILSVFAVKINKYLGLKGHVWYDRFKSKIIKEYIQYINTFQYISNNPVKAQMCNNSLDYKYGGLKFIFEKIYDFIEPPDSLLQQFIPGIAGLLLE